MIVPESHPTTAPRVSGIGLALSGGGVRATAFHLGVMARFAADDLLEHVAFVSSVSGGSLAVGLVFAQNDNAWPNSDAYLNSVVARARTVLTTKTTQWSYVWRSFALPWRLFRGRAHVLAGVLLKHWGVDVDLQALPATPQWFINATGYETGKNWRFSRQRMGDYQTHYVASPTFPVADAIASSAAVPGLIGPLVVRTKSYDWHRFEDGVLVEVRPKAKRYDLWDGGVYDNLGLEALHKPNGGARQGLAFIVVSDASARVDFDERSRKRYFKPGHRTLRLVDIATDQIRAMRARTLVADFKRDPELGVYLRMGNTTGKIWSAAGKQAPDFEVLDAVAVEKAATLKTTLRRLSTAEFDRLYRHGFEVTDATLCSRQGGRFAPRCIDGVFGPPTGASK